MTVNLSAKQFQKVDIVNDIARVLKEAGLDPKFLELEITESVAMQDIDITVKTLQELDDMGISIAIDDFGTGHSSLNYLRRFPIHTLKIDRSFIRDVVNNSEDAAIVSTIITLAQNLKLHVVAEGVENESQLEFLKQRKCFAQQGFLFAKPMPPEEFEEVLKKKTVF